ncbi:MAG TPA: FUSC family protein [Candidatus Baltobacteraceae bacterium]|jgi:hypothetical protein
MVRATVTLLAVVISFLAEAALCARFDAGSGPAMTAAFLALGLGRRATTRSLQATLIAIATLPLVAIAGTAFALLAHTEPIAGAALYVVAMSLAVWSRGFGERWARIGEVVAFPLLAMLIVPAAPRAPGGTLVDLGLIIAAGIVPYVMVTLLSTVALRLNLVHADHHVPRPPTERSRNISMRMAPQVVVSLSAAFALGMLVFPHHVAWVVLTAFIVSGATRGREDAAYRALARVAGAVGGTIAAAVLQYAVPADASVSWAVILICLFAGTALREFNYAYWAAAFTLVLAMLQRFGEGFSFVLLGSRIEAIIAGAICGVLAAWFVMPIPTKLVARRLVADALNALLDLFASGERPRERHHELRIFEHRIKELDNVGPALAFHRRLPTVDDDDHASEWIGLLRSTLPGVRALTTEDGALGEERRAAIERAVQLSRRALGKGSEPVAMALRRLKASVDER